MRTTDGNGASGAVEAARGILRDFARRTGVVGDAPQRRYLWTDAFAVQTLLALPPGGMGGGTGAGTGGGALVDPRALALALVDAVHGTLGRHRPDDARRGWISGLGEQEGRLHPTLRGLRIGKELPERGPDEPYDEALEWERDGQYFHYLTKWMTALGAAARATGEERFLRQAIELARAAHAGFAYRPPGSARPRMWWKASIDLTRPLVPSMGAHDPLDGLVTARALASAALRRGWSAADVGLDAALEDYRAMCVVARRATDDPLGIGGLLTDALRLARLSLEDERDVELLPSLVDGAALGLEALARQGGFRGQATRRLAFRELGLAIGLAAVPELGRLVAEHGPALGPTELARRVEDLGRAVPLARELCAFWLVPAHQEAESWRAHLDIDAVTLAAALIPAGVLAPV